MRYGIFVHGPDFDMGDGVIVGSFRTMNAACRKAEAIQKAQKREYDEDLNAVECIVLPLWPGSESASRIARYVIPDW